MLEHLEALSLGEWADIVGIISAGLTLIGFAATLYGVYRSKTAAESAKLAAQEARDSIRILDTVVDFTAAISILEDIKRAHRQEQWILLPDRYAAIRKTLILISTNGKTLTDNQRITIKDAIVNLKQIEDVVEKALPSGATLKAAKLNRLISSDIDNLVAVLAELKDLGA